MRTSRRLSILFSAALLFSFGVAAAESNKTTVQLDDKLIVEGKALETGKYIVEWSGSGPTVQVTLLHGKQTVATFSAQLTEQATANPQAAYSTQAGSDGSKTLTAIYPSGKRFSLRIDPNQASSPSNTSSAN
jgi:hypothetical protein